MFKGIDISYAQDSVNFKRVKGEVDFVMIKLANIRDTGLQIDSKFHQHHKECVDQKIPFGVYVYSYVTSTVTASQNALYVWDYLNNLGIRPSYPIALDYEEAFYANYSKTLNTDIACSFLSQMEMYGCYVTLYSMKSALETWFTSSRIAKYDKWVAQWSEKCTYNGDYGMWQHSSTGTIKGIAGDVDLNVSYLDYDKIIRSNGLNGHKRVDMDPIALAGYSQVVKTLKRLS